MQNSDFITRSGIYLHIPFCTSKCHYCDFFSKVVSSPSIKQNYSKAVIRELKQRLHELEGTEISSIYIGGGSPSLMNSDFFAQLYDFLSYFIDFDKIEYTVEINLNDIDTDWIEKLKSSGVNRVSAGIQAFDDSVLKEIGRRTTVDDIRKNLPVLAKNFTNLSIDLIYGFGKNRNISNELSELFTIADPVHVSAYQYTPPDSKSAPVLLDENELEAQEKIIRDFLQKEGFHRYEISNYSKKGFESVHNMIYWNYGSWLGIGAGAKSFNSIKKEHSFYDENINSFIHGDGLSRYKPDILEQVEEFLLMGLRLTDGIKLNNFNNFFGATIEKFIHIEVINKLIDEKLIEKDEFSLRVTEKGSDFLNRVLITLFDGMIR